MAQSDVKGYEGNPGYDGPYHPSAELNPDIKFVNGGDTEAAGKLEAEAFEKAKELRAEREKQSEESLESWELEQAKTLVVQGSDDYPDFVKPGTYQPPVTTEGKTFAEEVKESSDDAASDSTAASGSDTSVTSDSDSSGSTVDDDDDDKDKGNFSVS
jgi:hypothetical protein